MPRRPECRECHEVLPKASPGGLCPRCLMGGIIAESDQPENTAGSFADDFNTPSAETGGTGHLYEDPMEGTRIGDYKLLQRIGEGGFGLVYMAEQVEFIHRKVALKIIKAGMDTKQVIARFEAERQALAMMDHPNIARVLDVGETEEGRPYFVMELVKGMPITTYCQEEKLTTEVRLQLFMQVCTAVQHAHMKGIIHRDLKPSNILITLHDGDPVPKVIDFGIAKAMDQRLTDKTLFTRYDHMVGTPAYMSPEQAALSGLDVDTRSDVYALGVLLYELLTGTTPFDAETLRDAAFDEMRRMIREDEPAKPSTRLTNLKATRETPKAAHPIPRSGTVAQDLDWIAMKALEKDRRRRYDTANALAADVERYLADEPVAAGPPTASYRLSKFFRRNKPALATAATILVILIAASIISTVSAVKATDAENRATKNFDDLQSSYIDLDAAYIDLDAAYIDLDSANKTAHLAQQKTQSLLVRTLLEKGTAQFNEGDVTGLITLQEAVTAAEGNSTLQSKAMELWTLAHAWLPGSVEYVIDQPYAVAIAPDESLVAWCDSTTLHLYQPAGRNLKSAELDPRLVKVSMDPKLEHLDYLGLKFSDDGRIIAIHNPERGISQAWEVATLRPTTGILEHPESNLKPVKSIHLLRGWHTLDLSSEGRFLATLNARGVVCLWDLSNEKLATVPWEFPVRPMIAAFTSNDRNLLISAAEPDPITRNFVPRFYAIELHNQFQTVSSAKPISGASEIIELDDGYVIANHYREICLREPDSGSYTAKGSWSAPRVEDMAIHRGKNILAAGCLDGGARLLSATSLQELAPPLNHGGVGVRALGFSADGSVLATGGHDGNVKLWAIGKTPSHIGTWHQGGTIDQLVTTSQSGDSFITKSRARDASQPPRAILRRFPTSLTEPIATLPAATTVADISSDGSRLLLLSENRRTMTIRSQSGEELSSAPKIDQPDATITAAQFYDEDRKVILSIDYPDRQHYRSWDIQSTSFGSLDYRYNFRDNYVFGVLPTTPPLMVTRMGGWQVDMVDITTSSKVTSVGQGNKPLSFTIAEKLGWYAVGDRSGKLARFSIIDHQEQLPPLRHEYSISSAACSEDNRWLITKYKSGGTDYLRAWLIDENLPFRSLQVPIPLGSGPIFPVGERGFVYQVGDNLLRFDLPELSYSPDQIEALTRAALAVRKDPSGELQVLSADEFESARRASHTVE